MDAFLKNLTSASWWLSVALVGIALNIGSAYLKAAVDRNIVRVTSRMRHRSVQRREAYVKEVRRLRENPIEQLFAAAIIIWHTTQAIFLVIIGSFLSLFAFLLKLQRTPLMTAILVATMSLAAILFMLAFRSLISNYNMNSMLWDARHPQDRNDNVLIASSGDQ